MSNYCVCLSIAWLFTILCRLRLSSHRLFIEHGRWKSIPRVDRKCKLCNEIEDEYHVMLLCPRYPVLKKKLS